MPFQYILANLLAENKEAIGVLFLDGTGETVDVSCVDFTPYDMKVIGAYFGIYLKNINRFLGEWNLGRTEALHIEKDKLHLFAQPLPDEYFLVLVMKRPALTARARRTMNKAASLLEAELF